MCKYCERDFADRDYIINSHVNILDAKEYLSIDIDGDNNLNLFVTFGMGDGKSFKKRINYCPICGKKLETSQGE